MGIFSASSQFDPLVEKATAETNTKEDWAVILDICDKVSTSSTPQAPKECLRAIMKRLNNPDPHVAIQAVTVLDACVSNAGLPFHLEIASREFEGDYIKLLQKTTEKAIRDKLLHCLEKWVLNEFKNNPQLDLIPSLYHKLKSSGTDFPGSENSPANGKKGGGGHHHKSRSHSHGQGASSAGSGAQAAQAQQEADDIAKAIELSLKEAQQSPKSSLYPQGLVSATSGSSSTSHPIVPEPRKVRALYDFEAAEDNELTFYAGEIVHVVDDTDPNWWEGSNQRGTGLFPANFVTADLSAEPPKEATNRKTVQFNEEVEVKTVEVQPEVVEIDEAKISSALDMLHEADVTAATDPPELALLEEQVEQMGPLIDQELEKIDRRHAQLTRLGSELVDALNMYHNLMREPVPQPQQGPPVMNYPQMPPGVPYQYYAPPGSQYGPPTSLPPPGMMQHPGVQQVPNGIPPQVSISPTHLPITSPQPSMSIPPNSQPQQQQIPQMGHPPHSMIQQSVSSHGPIMMPGVQGQGPNPMMQSPQPHPVYTQQQLQQSGPQGYTPYMPPQGMPSHFGAPPSQFYQQPATQTPTM